MAAVAVNWLLPAVGPSSAPPPLLPPPLDMSPVPHRYMNHQHKGRSDNAEFQLFRAFQSGAGATAATCAAAAAHGPGPRVVLDGLAGLPGELVLEVLARLGPRELCAVARTCRALRGLAEDDRLWQKLLLREMPRWHTVGSDTLPGHQALFFNVKNTYLACSPLSRSPRSAAAREKHRWSLQAALGLGQLRWFREPKVHKVVVCGLGLEHGGAGLISQLLYGHGRPFTVTGMTAGHNGSGGGVTLRHRRSAAACTLISVHHRRYRDGAKFPRSSRRIADDADAVVFVVDADRVAEQPRGAGADAETGVGAGGHGHGHERYRREAALELAHMTPPPGVPLLVLSLVPPLPGVVPPPPVPPVAAVVHRTVPPPPARPRRACASTTDVASAFMLGTQPRAWRVSQVDVATRNAHSALEHSDYLGDSRLADGFAWLFHQLEA